MENAQLISLSRQLALRNQMDVVANNLANMTTTGYKAEQLMFEDYLMPKASAETFKTSDEKLHYVIDYESKSDFQNGSIKGTDAPLDVALSGEGFFTVIGPNGPLYTRAGSFTMAPDGTLVTQDGYKVVSDAGDVTFNPNDTDITISGDGTISANTGRKGKLLITTFDQPNDLERVGKTMFSANGQQGTVATTTSVTQGAVETANVRPIVEMTRMIEVSRAYEELSNMMKRQDDMRTDAIDKLAQVNA